MIPLLLSSRAVLRLAGPDARDFLQGLLTNDMMALAPGRPLYAGLLSAQGKALHALLLFDGADAGLPGEVLVDVDAGQAGALARRLGMYKLRKAVTIALAPELGVWVALEGMPGRPDDGKPDPRHAALGSRWLAPKLENAPEGDAVWAAHRRRLGVAEAAEIGEDQILWLETGAGLLNGVSFTKGCYVGQENTARMHHRDKLRKLILPFAVADGEVADPQLRDGEGRVVGALRGGIEDGVALVHVRLEALDGQPLVLDGRPARLLAPQWAAGLLPDGLA
jgi:folate-binding protein YgfZ